MTPFALTLRLAALAACIGCASRAEAGSGHGRAFTLAAHPARSARAAFREAALSLRAQHLEGLRIRSAAGDRGDRFVEAFFDADDRGTRVSGVAFADTSGHAGGVVDTPDALPASFPALMRTLQRMLGRSETAARPPSRAFHDVSFGSGTVALPDTWRVTGAYQGCVEAISDRDRGYIALGCPQHGTVPPGLPGTNPAIQLVAPYGSPARMLREVAGSPMPVGLGLGRLQILEQKAIGSGLPNGSAAYLLFDYRMRGKPFRGLAMIAVAPIDEMTYLVYKSMFLLPAETFARDAPAMWRSWQSWRVNGSVFDARLAAAARSMRETGDLITGAYWERQHATDAAAHGFDQYIRDTATLENTSTGRRYEGNALTAQAFVDHDPATYRIVPSSELGP